MEGAQVRDIGTLARFLAGVPLGRLLVSEMFPRRDGEGAVGLPIIQNFGVDTRSGSRASTVHTGYAGMEVGDGVDQAEQRSQKRRSFLRLCGKCDWVGGIVLSIGREEGPMCYQGGFR